MSVLSKYTGLVPVLRTLRNGGGFTPANYAAWRKLCTGSSSALSRQLYPGSWILLGKKIQDSSTNHQIRLFRWDAKADNQFGHSFRQGFRAKAHPTFTFFIVLLIIPFIDWRSLISEDTPFVPKFVRHMLCVISGKAAENPVETRDDSTMPSSLAGKIYDLYGDIGIDAMKVAWGQVKNKDWSPEQKAVHAIMVAQAAHRYEEDVAAEAAALGLEKEDYQDEKPPVNNEHKSSSPALGMFNLKAEEAQLDTSATPPQLEGDGEERKGEKVGFRDRKIIEYENRMRQYSTPDKVFRYFSTIKIVDEKGNSEVMMTPEDFLRSMSPGEKQPDNLGLDQFLQVNEEGIAGISRLQNIDQKSIFYQLGSGGLISFSDYIFLLTVLSTSRRHFQIAFKMFDLNGDGTVDAEEFQQVTTLLRSNSSTGARHRDHGSNSTFKGINSGLISFFFGEDKNGTLTVERFLEFQRRLQEDILALEFKRKDSQERGKISERDFADLLIAYAGFSNKKKTKMLRRVRKTYEVQEEEEESPGISLKDYLNFYQVLYCINDIDTALTFHTIAGAPIERSTMAHVARTVAHVDLTEHLVDVVFTLFDDNGDGKLSNKEFVSVMKQRAKRGLEKPKEIGISRVFSSVFKCAADCKPAIMGGLKKTE